ncbi:hypothetical protein MARI_04290 [Marinobacter sp. JH2]|nr:hypothetical protein MARI_04290 [Marinobacter sp. JH2]
MQLGSDPNLFHGRGILAALLSVNTLISNSLGFLCE